MIAVTSPATLADIAAVSGRCSRQDWAAHIEMLEHGETFALRAGGELVGVAGLYPLLEGGEEAWFSFLPGAPRHMLGIVRAIRLTLARDPYRVIVTVCRTEAGRRIARAAGLSFQAVIDGMEVWARGGHV